jgi:hypothetical protein
MLKYSVDKRMVFSYIFLRWYTLPSLVEYFSTLGSSIRGNITRASQEFH